MIIRVQSPVHGTIYLYRSLVWREAYADFTTSDSKLASDSFPSAASFRKDALYRLVPLIINNHEP